MNEINKVWKTEKRGGHVKEYEQVKQDTERNQALEM